MTDLVSAVREADLRIRPFVPETPLARIEAFSATVRADVLFKGEHLLPTGSFKLRGAFNRLLVMTPAEREAGVTTASSGNHGAAVAFAAAALGIAARVYVPEGASPAKVQKIRAQGAEVVHFGTDGLDSEVEARAAASRNGSVYVSPYNDLAVMAGQGTVATEIERQAAPLDRLFVAVGGGGLIAGVAAYLASASPGVEVVGVLPEHSPVMAVSVRAGHIIEMESRPTLSDGTAGGIEPGSITFPVCRDQVHRWVTVSEDEIADAMRQWARTEGGMIEGAAGVAIAGVLREAGQLAGQRVGVVVCGGNITSERWQGVVAPA